MSGLNKETIEKIEELVKKGEAIQKPIEIDGVKYVKEGLTVIDNDKRPEGIGVGTLSSFCDYINLNPEGVDFKNCFIHITGHNRVKLREKYSGLKKARTLYIEAEIDSDINPFRFKNWYTVEDLIINLQAHFEDTQDRALILKRIGNIESEKNNGFKDDGVSQTVIAKTGLAETGEVKIPNPVMLSPYRTFREIRQPDSTFIFRIKAKDSEVTAAIFEADGAAWKLDAINHIRSYIMANLNDDKKSIPILG